MTYKNLDVQFYWQMNTAILIKFDIFPFDSIDQESIIFSFISNLRESFYKQFLIEPQQIMELQKIQNNETPYRITFTEVQKWKQYLQQNGFVVIKNYLPQVQCQKYIEEFWDIMETLSDGKLDRNDVKTQSLAKNYPVVLHGGMIQYVGHSKPQWELRELCKPIFSTLWQTDQVKSSFDGFCFMNGRRKYRPREDDAFLHVDQSPTKNFIWSYQGIMSLTKSGQKEGGFVCIPSSHKEHRDYFKSKNLLDMKDNWYVVPNQDRRRHPFENVLKVNTQAGDFILFDSRTFHCNTVPIVQTLRVCTYICMLPSDRIPKQIHQKRQDAYKQRRTTNHHPGDGFKMFSRVPRYLSNPKQFQTILKEINFSYKLTESQLELI